MRVARSNPNVTFIVDIYSANGRRPRKKSRTGMSNNLNQQRSEWLAELERRGAELEKDITKHALYRPMSMTEILSRWQPDHRPN
jgi:hypothetical protein